MKPSAALALVIITLALLQTPAAATDSIVVRRTTDFLLSGDGQSNQWGLTQWQVLPQRRNTQYKKETKFKMLYSATGIYFLFSNEDEILTATRQKDFDSLWVEDVNEVFLWPDTTETIYFEYEISPLNYELPILVPNIRGNHLGWRPWIYEENRKTRHATAVVGGKKKSGSKIREWLSEFFIPFELLAPLHNRVPQPGTIWKANLYRVDYDHKEPAVWAWQPTEGSFHQFQQFGKLVFE
ncbi:MAG TPA: carbohydrate-binding family 9-like protein [Flavisolibacter sp.]|jgi:hypothetical protein|nr:carbohydrate-binding family 9-like protein [Flavisolibacter sp.]